MEFIKILGLSYIYWILVLYWSISQTNKRESITPEERTTLEVLPGT